MKDRFCAFLCVIVLLPFLLFSQPVKKKEIPRDTSYTIYSAYKKIKKNYPFVSLIDEKLSKGVIQNKNITYKIIDQTDYGKRELKLTVFRPEDKQIYPAVLIIHGGGWSSGAPGMMTAFAQNLCLKGFTAVCVEYRLTPEAIYPAAVDDLNDAVMWIYKNATRYKLNKNKIAVAGFSAGGQLASLIGTKNKDKLIKAVVNVDGITNFIEKETIDRAEKAKRENTKIPVDALWLGGTFSEKSEVWKDASSVFWVTENSAPTLFICSSIPRFHNGRDEYIQNLNRFGIYYSVYTFDDCPHSFWLFSPWQSITIQKMADFLNKTLK